MSALVVVRSVSPARPRRRCASFACAVALALLPACPPPAERAPAVAPALDVPRLDGERPAQQADGRGVRFGRVPPVAGARWAVSVLARSTATDPQGGTQLTDYTSSYTVEVLATEGPAPTRVRLAFERNAYRFNGASRPTSIDGKTYVVDRTAPFVRDASGGSIAAEESQRVLDVFPELGTRTEIDQVLPDAPMEIGERRDDLATAVLRVLHPRAWTLDGGTATLVRTEADEAVFAVAIAATGSNGLRMDVKGEVRIRLRDARLTSIALDGPYATTPDGPAASDPTSGVITIRRTVRDL